MAEVKVAATIAPQDILDNETLSNINENHPYIDIIELRIDQWESHHHQKLIKNLSLLNELKDNFKILVTYRTASQGGKGQLTNKEYLQLIETISSIDSFQMIDIEWESTIDDERYKRIIENAHRHQKQIIVSYHNFSETPPLEEIKFTYYKMQKLNPEYVKIAVMPKEKQDVATLLEAVAYTSEAISQHVIGISMSHIGLVTRTAQGVFGGTMSYGCLGEPQAPGQIHVKELKKQLLFYENM
ncbi:3-dehydroquinate dehydratase I [Staphylococcus hominis]